MPRLPDEIISEILSPALKVADELFSDASDASPFANPTPSTSAYLLVCKDWLRVATPLLYNVVVLRSKAQVAAFQEVLRKNPGFGGFVKKLRVEGGYGMAMHFIIVSAPNITDLFLTLAIWSSDNTDGLCKGLPLLNPHRVIVVDPVANLRKAASNKRRTALSQALFSCIPKWKNLQIFGFPYRFPQFTLSQHNVGWTELARSLIKALIKSETIHTVLLPRRFEFDPFFHPLLDIPNLRILNVPTPREEQYHEEIVKTIKSRGKLNVSVRYTVPDSPRSTSFKDIVCRPPDIAPSLNPCFVPMASASAEVREAVWKRVFLFVLFGDLCKPSQQPGPTTEGQPSRLAILLVSKHFNRLALSASYTKLHVQSRNAPSVIQQLHNHPNLGSSIRSINLSALDDAVMRSIIIHASRVQKIETWRSLSAEGFELLAATSGPTLRELTNGFGIDFNSTICASSFAHFTTLQVYRFHGQATVAPASESAPRIVLAKLHTLHLIYCDATVFDAFSKVNLPSLRAVKVNYDVCHPPALIGFLRAHGGSLDHLELKSGSFLPSDGFSLLDVCSSLLDVEFYAGFDFGPLLIDTCKEPHRSLAKITCGIALGNAEHVDPALFPALREIQCRGCRWPKTEREISKNRWVPLAETLLEKNIKLTDSEGRHWIPRLKNARGKK